MKMKRFFPLNNSSINFTQQKKHRVIMRSFTITVAWHEFQIHGTIFQGDGFFSVLFVFPIIGMFITFQWTLSYCSYRCPLIASTVCLYVRECCVCPPVWWNSGFHWRKKKNENTVNRDKRRLPYRVSMMLHQISFDWMNITCACVTK